MKKFRHKCNMNKVLEEIFEECEEEYKEHCKKINAPTTETEMLFIYYRLIDEKFKGVQVEDVRRTDSDYYTLSICKNGNLITRIDCNIDNNYRRNPIMYNSFNRFLTAFDFSPYALQQYLEILPYEVSIN